MGRRKHDGLTPRQRQSQQIMRDKMARKKRKVLLRKVGLAGGALLCACLLAGGVWAVHSGFLSRGVASLQDSFYGMTARSGYAVRSLYLEGRNRTSVDELEQALGIRKGDPILRISIDEVRERLQKIESIKFAEVERSLPSTLHVRIVEREPVALWQHQGKLSLVDDNGVVMTGIDIEPYRRLPLIVGEGAPREVRELISIMSSSPELAKRFSSATRISERRWNIRLSSDKGDAVEVRLPESNPVSAWKKLADIDQKQRLLERDVKVIDLRLEGKVFIKLSPDVFTGKDGVARET